MSKEEIIPIDWAKNKLIPAVAQDYLSKEVLMLAYMDKEAYELSLSTKIAHYFSRSKNRIWQKGETSGHVQHIKELRLDCDQDSIVMQIEQVGVACHTGSMSCFFRTVFSDLGEQSSGSAVLDLYKVIQEKKSHSPETSYTAQLFSKGENAILKKIAEEASEFCFAIKDNDHSESVDEAADLLYHALVAMAYRNIAPAQVSQELKRRFTQSGLEEKQNRSS